MRILLDYRPALRERTGVGEYAHQLAAAVLRRISLADTFTIFSSSWKDRLDPTILPGSVTLDVKVPVTLLNLAWHRLEWPPIETFAGDVDVTHSLHPLLMPARRAAQVVTVHDLFFLDNPDNTGAEIRRDYPALAAAHARRADVVVSVSEYTAGQVVSRLGVPRDAIVLCRSGAPPWKPSARPLEGPILFMGTIEPRKNVETLLHAYALLLERRPSAPQLTLAGGVSPACRNLLDDLNKPPLAGRAKHIGYVAGYDRERLYREASMLVMPSLDEGFGLPALEAMTLGLPVVASNRGALPEVVGDAGILVDPLDAGALAAAMARLLEDPARARQATEDGIARARRFSWDASAARLMDAYALAIERRRSRR